MSRYVLIFNCTIWVISDIILGITNLNRNEDVAMEFHERLKQLREQNGWTQNNIASVLNIAKSTYVKYERGEREPRYGTLVALSEIFQVSIDYLLGKSEIDNVYKERIDSAYQYVTSDQFAKEHSQYLESVNKLISNYLRLLYFEDSGDAMLDILFLITKIEGLLMDLYILGRHIFCYEKWAAEDEEYKHVVDIPTTADITQFISKSQEIRKLLDDYIGIISTEGYFRDPYLIYEREIRNYSQNDWFELITKFRDNPGYKME